MGIVNIVLLVGLFAGFALIVLTLALLRGESSGEAPRTDEALKAIEASVSEADQAIEEMNKMAKNIFEEIDNRYQELLFLYNMIDEKSAGLKTHHTNLVINEKTRIPYTNPKLVKIQKLFEEGQSIADIARGMNMGQGEVKLILDLGKDR